MNFDTRNANTMINMFGYATSFNQPIHFQADNLGTASRMFEHSTSFNQPVTFVNSTMLRNMWRMFAGNRCFNSTVNISSTARPT